MLGGSGVFDRSRLGGGRSPGLCRAPLGLVPPRWDRSEAADGRFPGLKGERDRLKSSPIRLESFLSPLALGTLASSSSRMDSISSILSWLAPFPIGLHK